MLILPSFDLTFFQKHLRYDYKLQVILEFYRSLSNPTGIVATNGFFYHKVYSSSKSEVYTKLLSVENPEILYEGGPPLLKIDFKTCLKTKEMNRALIFLTSFFDDDMIFDAPQTKNEYTCDHTGRIYKAYILEPSTVFAFKDFLETFFGQEVNAALTSFKMEDFYKVFKLDEKKSPKN